MPRIFHVNEPAAVPNQVHPGLVCFCSHLWSATAHDVYLATRLVLCPPRAPVRLRLVGILEIAQMVLRAQPRSAAEGMLCVLEGVTC